MGRSDVFSFEIVTHRDKITFHVSMPSEYKTF